MKNLYMIGGAMGIGKTTVARLLADKLPQAVYFDGDSVWELHPLVVNGETIQLAHENIAFMLQQFLTNSQIENVVFTWVLHEQKIIDKILSDLQVDESGYSSNKTAKIGNCEFRIYNISLIADEATLRRNFLSDETRNPDNLAKSLSYLAKYEKLDTVKFDRTGKSPEDTANEILSKFHRLET